MKHKHNGFTIIELLIVIVVIAILAAISIVAYNGIQDRANNTKTENAASQYRRALILYATDKGTYPLNGSISACLGAVGSYPSGCWNGNVSNDFINELSSNIGTGSLPTPYTGCLDMYGSCRRGVAYSNRDINLDGASHIWSITYLLKGDVRCTADGQTGGTWTNATSTANSSGYIERDSGTTMCRLHLPNPAKL